MFNHKSIVVVAVETLDSSCTIEYLTEHLNGEYLGEVAGRGHYIKISTGNLCCPSDIYKLSDYGWNIRLPKSNEAPYPAPYGLVWIRDRNSDAWRLITPQQANELMKRMEQRKVEQLNKLYLSE